MRNALSILLVVAGCSAGPISSPMPPVDDCGDFCIEYGIPRNKIDFLLVLDDAPSMAVKLASLRAALPQLIASFDAQAQEGSPTSYHLGVVTADLGAGPDAIGAEGCRPGGDGAKLRAAPAPDAQAPPACAALSLSGGVRYIDDNQLVGSTNIGGGLDVATALSCLSEVGSIGCEFRHPLEAAYVALREQIPENVSFLRSDAILVVVFVSDADDCSAPMDSDLFDGSSAGVAAYGPLDHFRCSQLGIACNGQPLPPTALSGLTGCEPQPMAAGGKLFDVDRYIDFFTKPAAQGGVKVDPNDVILEAVSGPSDPVGVQIATPCPDANGGASCPVLDHSCVLASDATFFGDPAVRLDSVVRAAKNNDLTSICHPDYSSAFANLRGLHQGGIGPGCFDKPVADRADGTPDCIVTEKTTSLDGTETTTELPSCAENGDATPCWQLVDELAQYTAQGCGPRGMPSPPTCKLPPWCQPVTDPRDGSQQLFTITIDRGRYGSGFPIPPPPGTVDGVSCAQP